MITDNYTDERCELHYPEKTKIKLGNQIKFFGANLDVLTMAQSVKLIDARIHRQEFTQHVVVNVAKLVHMQSDPELTTSVNDCDIVNIDGMGVVLGARFLGINVPQRVAGVDLFNELLALSAEKEYPVYLLGAKDDVVSKTAEVVEKKHANLNVAGFHHGYFWDDEEAVVKKIRESGAKLLFVAITSPKKENFINKWKGELGVDFVMGVGGSFDVVAGRVTRAPLWMQNSGMEWLYRLLQEPRRMWKRYLTTNVAFAFMLIKSRLKQVFGSSPY